MLRLVRFDAQSHLPGNMAGKRHACQDNIESEDTALLGGPSGIGHGSRQCLTVGLNVFQ